MNAFAPNKIVPVAQVIAGTGAMSFANGVDARKFRAFFSPRWAAFLRANFQSSEHIALVFGVTARTADNWLAGTSRPYGDTIALFFMRCPDAVAWFTAGE